MYQFSYGELVDESPEEMRARERQAMDQVIAMLRRAAEDGLGSRSMVQALYDLHRLWSIFLEDLSGPDNGLPDNVKAGLVSIGIWVTKEIERVRTGGCRDIAPLIEINEIVRDGLK